ncbi:MAG: hypothetical protein NUV97_01120 [archaeon]|nr:hypothetical protein [archaeon]MCR4323437.1 hypothetical protein [Nanoarchaeota archaeon]
MKKWVSYTIAISGLVIMAIGFGTFKLEWAILNTISPMIITIAGVILIVVGVLFSLMGGSGGNQAAREVPIYEGEGKNRKIVAYQRSSDD